MTTPSEIIYGDSGYTGDTPGALGAWADADYYRDKMREFQVNLNALAATADQIGALRNQLTDADSIALCDAWLDDYTSNRGKLLTAAEAANAAANAANFVGLRMPVLSIPQQLGFAGIDDALTLAAIAAAAAGIAWAISYAVSKVADARAITARRDTVAMLPEPDRAAFLAADQKIALAQANAGGVLGQIAGVAKYIALGLAVYFGYRALQGAGVLR